MNRFLLKAFLLTFAILPLAAQDRFHVGVEMAYQGSQSQSEDFITVSADQRTQPGVEVGWRPLSLGPVDIRLVAAMRAKVTSDVTLGGYFRYTDIGTLSHQSIALGAEATWHRGVEVGAGLQLRQERMTLTITDATPSEASVTLYRPWLTSHVGWSWKLKGVTPYVHGLLSVPLTKDYRASVGSGAVEPSEQLAKALAPSIEIGARVGVRF